MHNDAVEGLDGKGRTVAIAERRKQVRRQSDRELKRRLEEIRQDAGEGDSKELRRKRRRAIRHTCKVHIALTIGTSTGHSDTWNTGEHPIKGRILDLSGDGASVFTAEQIDVGLQLKLIIMLERGEGIRTVGVVRWTKAVKGHNGFASGVQFAHIQPKDRQLIASFLKELDETIGL